MKIMEKLTESKFGKFEGNEITGLMYLKGGGECTGGGGINQGFEISDYDEINIRLAHARGRMERMKVLKLCKAQATTMTVSLNSVL